MSVVLAAIDLGPFSRRVLRHAAGFARMLDVPLRVMHVTPDPSPDAAARVVEFCERQGPYEVNLAGEDVLVRTGRVSDAIYREAERAQAALVVIGSRGHAGVARLLLGSTSESVLRNAPAPILLVPPADFDIVNITDRVSLTCGPVLAAIDPEENGGKQLHLAGRLAAVAGQGLVMMTVAPRRVDEHAAMASLRERAHALDGVKPRALIVRRGRVAEEIARSAVNEGAGLVVMGLRANGRGKPGTVATAVLGTHRTFVMAVPE